ncbi:MAG: tetraacyldisaccharide 4'-kinase [Pontibacterium sp.]
MNWIERRWYQSKPITCLRPLSALFGALAHRRRLGYSNSPSKVWDAPVPVIVVGNITVGGTGKTPLVTYLVELLRANGYTPGVISRGYGGKSDRYPLEVTNEVSAQQAGDEPKLIQTRCQCPVFVGPQRVEAAKALLKAHRCDVIISDDGLQHYALGRDIEIAVVDGQRGFGNQALLPAGPLREPLERLHRCQFVVQNGHPDQIQWPKSHQMNLQSDGLFSVADIVNSTPSQPVSAEETNKYQTVTAFAGIGHPQRFFDQLSQDYAFKVEGVPLADHTDFRKGLPQPQESQALVCTEKDAIKLIDLGQHKASVPLWYLRVSATLPPIFDEGVLTRLAKVAARKSSEGETKNAAASA